jgi:hypothetical protein
MNETLDLDVARIQLATAVAHERQRTWILRVLFTIALTCVIIGMTTALVVTRRASEEKSGVIEFQSQTIEDINHKLNLFTESDSCLNAYSRRITETQNTYLTEGFGGLVAALADSSPERPAAIEASLAQFRTTRDETKAAVVDRDNYVKAGAPLPCPIPTTPS